MQTARLAIRALPLLCLMLMSCQLHVHFDLPDAQDPANPPERPATSTDASEPVILTPAELETLIADQLWSPSW